MKDFNNLLARITHDDENKRDFQESADKLRINNEGRLIRLTHLGKEGLQFSEFAFTQLLNRYKLDVKSTKATIHQNPKAVYDLVNEFLASDDKPILIRARVIQGRGVIRAILSENYVMLNNKDIVNSIATTLNETKLNPKIETSYIDDGRTHIRVTFDPYTEAFGTDIHGTDDIIKSGVDIINSETGRSSFRLEPMVYRQVCSNGLKAWTGDKENENFNQRHIFISNAELNKMVIDGIRGSINTATKIADSFEETKKIIIPNPAKTIMLMCEDQNYSKKLTKQILKSYNEEPMKSRYGVVNAFTRGARGLSNQQRLEVEKFAGRLLGDESLYEKIA